MQRLSLSLDSFTTFGELLRYLRQRERLTQRELSVAVGYSESQINRLEKNLRLPEASIIAAQFVPALHLEAEPQVAARLIELAAQARGEPMPASLNFTRATRREVTETGALPRKRHTNLPMQLTRFIGRQDELAELTTRVKMARLLTLTGSGGVGKTRLASEVASSLMDAFPDGVWLVEFAPFTDESLVAQAVAGVLGVTEQPGTPVEDALLAWLRDRRALLIFDNCEHLVVACAALVERLLHACPDLHILATSREPLRIAGEVTWRVPSLSAPESIRLFAERACAVRPDFDLTNNNAVIAHICQQLDGIPLAIELAVARVSSLSVEQIAARLDDRFALLNSGNRTALPRHKTLRALIDWSYTLLDPAERTLFQQLSVFTGGFTAEAAQAVSDQTNTFGLLSNLVDKSLVIAEVRGEAARYRMLETIRQFADETLRGRTSDASEEHALRRHHLGFYLALAEMAESKLSGPETNRWLDQLDAERDNLRAAIDWAFANGEASSGLRLVGALKGYWANRGYYHEERQQLLKALAKSSPSERTSARAKVLNQAALVQWFLKHYSEAHALVEEALSIAVELGDQRNIAESFYCLQNEAFSGKDFATAYAWNTKALAIWRELGDKFKLAYMLCLHAELSRYQDHYDYDRARSIYEEAIDLFAELGEKPWRSVALRRFGRVVLHEGDVTKATVLCQQSLTLSLEASDEHVAASCLLTIGGIAVARGQSIRAARLFGAAEAVLKKLDISMMFADVYDYEADLHALRKQLDEATLNAAWAEGKAMSFDGAVEFALAE